jgi:integrase
VFPEFWNGFDNAGLIASSALKMILLTGQRPGEVACMCREHIKDGWWELPGAAIPKLKWPGTKNKENHRVWLPKPALALLAQSDEGHPTGLVFPGVINRLSDAMKKICDDLGVADRVRPHDLRRTHGTLITRLKFGRDAMNRIQNHIDGGIASVYDRHSYADENKKVMEAVASKIMQLVTGTPDKNVLQFGRNAAK